MLSTLTRGASTLTVRCFMAPALTSKRAFSIEEIGKKAEKPFDYKNKRYGLLGQVFDSTLRKLGENSIIITVEGNFGSGKSDFAKKLAKEIQFVYANEPDLDKHWFLDPTSGQNKRELINSIIGENKKHYVSNVEDWHRDPSYRATIQLQHGMYMVRFMQMRQALLHLMSTGQGVLLERSVFSDSVIGQSLYENRMLSDEAYKFYMRDLIPSTIGELWKPHVVIYLDKSPEDCLKTIQEKGKPFEKDSKAYTLNFLRTVEKNYKKMFLPEMHNHLHVLTYNSNEVDPEQVVEDLEMLDFEDQKKFGDWRIRKETQINAYRRVLSDYEYMFNVLYSVQSFVDVPEYLWYGDELVKLEQKLENSEKSLSYGPFSKIGHFLPQKDFF